MSNAQQSKKKQAQSSSGPSFATEVAAEGTAYAVVEGAGALAQAVTRAAVAVPAAVPAETFQTGGGLGGGDFASDAVAGASDASASWLSEALGSAGDLAGSAWCEGRVCAQRISWRV